MKQIGILMRLRLQALFSSLLYSKKGGPAKRRSPGVTALVIALLVLAFGSIVMMMATAAVGVAALAFEMYDMPWFYYTALALLSFLLMVITGIFTAKNQLFDSKDNDLLLAMPLLPRNILIARMLTLYLTDLLFEAFVMVPAGIVALFYVRPTFTGVLFYVLAILLLPLLALALSAFFGWVLAAVESRCRNKTIPQTILSMAFFILYFIFCFRTNEIMEAIAANAEGIAASLKIWAYPFYQLGVACADGKILPFLLFAAVCLVPMAVCVWLLSRSFLSIVTARRTAKKAVYRADREDRRVSSPLAALTKKELGYFFGCFPYLLNAGLGAVLMVLAGVFVLTGGNRITEILPALSEELGLSLTGDHAVMLLLALAFFVSSATDISAPSVSLEGTKLWIPLTIPVKPATVLLSKTLAHMIVLTPPTLFFSLCAVISAKPSPLMAVWAFLLPFLFNAVSALVGTLIGTRFPKLDWIDEAIAVKQSMAVLFSMLIMMGAVLLVCGLFAALTLLLPPVLSGAVMVLLLGGVVFGLYEIEEHGGARCFAQLG